MPLHVSSTCAHHQEVKIALHSLWYRHTFRCTGWERIAVLSQPVHRTATYRCDDIRCCVMQFWPPGDEHMCSKHVEAWNKLIVKQKFCASIWLITEINVFAMYVITCIYIPPQTFHLVACTVVCLIVRQHHVHTTLPAKYSGRLSDGWRPASWRMGAWKRQLSGKHRENGLAKVGNRQRDKCLGGGGFGSAAVAADFGTGRRTWIVTEHTEGVFTACVMRGGKEDANTAEKW